MVEIARLEEAGGGTRKYLQIPNARMFSYDLPRGQRPDTQRGAGTHNRGASELPESPMRLMGTTSSWCRRNETVWSTVGFQHYEEFIIQELLNRALLELGETGDLDDVLSQAR